MRILLSLLAISLWGCGGAVGEIGDEVGAEDEALTNPLQAIGAVWVGPTAIAVKGTRLQGKILFRTFQSPTWWTLYNPNRSSDVTALVSDGQFLLAATTLGVVRGASNFTTPVPFTLLPGPFNAYEGGSAITTLISDPRKNGTVYAGTCGRGLYVSTNHGSTWRPYDATQSGLCISSLAIDPQYPTNIFVGTSSAGGPSVDNNTVILFSDGSRFYLKNQPSFPTLTSTVTSLLATSSHELWMGTASNGLYRGVRGGASFSKVSEVTGVIRGLAEGSKIFIGTSNGVYTKSVWDQIYLRVFSDNITSLAVNPIFNDQLLVGTFAHGTVAGGTTGTGGMSFTPAD